MSSDGVHITRWGESGPAVVLIHGGAQGSASGGDRHFAAQRSLGDQGWRLLVPDRPGHGRSPWPGRPDDAEADSVWAAELLGDGAHLVGHSFGGCVALLAAARRPEAVRSLTLIEPAMHGLAADDPQVRRFLVKLTLAMLLSFSPAQRARRFVRLMAIPDAMRDASSPASVEATGRALRRLKVPATGVLRAALETIRSAGVPLLVVTGGWSAAFDAVGARVAALGGGRRQIVPSPHHFPNLAPGGFNALLEDFLSRSEAVAISKAPA